MTIDVTCSGCGSKYQVPDSFAGRRTQCKKCSGVMHIPAAEPADNEEIPMLAPDDPPDDPPVDAAASLAGGSSLASMLDEELTVAVDMNAPNPKCPSCGTDLASGTKICIECGLNLRSGQRVNAPVNPQKTRASPMAMRKTATGLSILFWGLVFQISVVIFAICLPMLIKLAGALFSWGSVALVAVILAAGMIAYGLAAIACIVGKCFCLTVPSHAVNKVIIILSVVFELQSVFLITGARVFGVSELVKAFSGLLAFVGAILFLIFVKQLAHYVGRRDLGDDAMAIIYQCIVLVCIFIGCIVMAIVGPLIVSAIESLIMAIVLSVLLFATIIGIFIFALMIVYRYVVLIGAVALAVRSSRRS